jgi:hypothetical protein
MVWKLATSSKSVKEWVVPSKKGLFIGGDRYASSVIAAKRRGTGKYWEVYVINKKAESELLQEKVSKSAALKFVKSYMKKFKEVV